MPRLAVDGLPILAGLSRKSTLGAIIGGKPPQARVAAAGAVAASAAHLSCACTT
jgi:dihydropteroate synthase